MEQILDTAQVETKPVYVGFWMRVAAYLIDGILLGIVQVILMFTVLGSTFYGMRDMQPGDMPPASMFGKMMILYAVIFAVQWLYFAGMESSAKQATIGKMAIGAKVTDLNGNRIGFGKATGRFFAKIISSLILCIGFMMVGFTEKKQGLHDQMAGTLVVKN